MSVKTPKPASGEVAGTTETVSVEAIAPPVADAGCFYRTTRQSKFINDLPLTSRSVFNLAQLSPGVTQSAGRVVRSQRGGHELHLQRRRNSTTDIVMDGVSQTNQENNGGITPSLRAAGGCRAGVQSTTEHLQRRRGIWRQHCHQRGDEIGNE